MKLVFIAGARPNFMKVAALIEACKKLPNIQYTLVHTGQHYDVGMSKVFFDELGLPKPDYNLGVGGRDTETQRKEIIEKLTPIFTELKPDVVVVVGDVTSTLAGAIAAKKLGISVAHVEAGLRSFNDKMPEEYNRRETDKISDYLFVTEPQAKQNLLDEGMVVEKIHHVGNVMIDTLNRFISKAEKLPWPLGESSPYAVVTLHRPENVDSDLESKIRLLNLIAKKIPVMFPVHPRTYERMKSVGEDRLKNLLDENLFLISPQRYIDFLALMKNAKLVLTDSGGIQEETTALGVPCLTLRNETERPITVEEGTNEIVGMDEVKIERCLDAILQGKGKAGRIPTLWDGHAAERIINILAR